MSQRPLVGIATQTLEAIPGKLPQCWVMGQRYVRALTGAGAVPCLIPLLSDDTATLRALYECLDALFLTGGVDVDPATYGEPRHEMCDRSDPARDETEITLIRWALADHKPILGVCRGIQILNVACGGTLHQHLADLPERIKHDYFPTATHYTRDFLAHDVIVTAGSRLGKLLGGAAVQVNSMHHQGIHRLASGLQASAHAPDGLIEGIEGSNGQYLIAVQWHPEELVEQHESMRRLFADFVSAAGTYRNR